VAYKDIPGGLLYAGCVFARRVTEPLQRKIWKSAESFREAGIKSGGEPVEIGDALFRPHAFPYVPLSVCPLGGRRMSSRRPSASFSTASVDHYLALEDIVVLGQVTNRQIDQNRSGVLNLKNLSNIENESQSIFQNHT